MSNKPGASDMQNKRVQAPGLLSDRSLEIESEGDKGTIAEGTSEAKFTNTRKTGGLEVSKKLISNAAADKDQEFEFTVTLNDDTINSGVFDMITKTYGDMTFKNGVATFRLKGGESITAENLPTELEYHSHRG